VNIAEALIDFAHKLGANTCFSLPGGMAMYLNKALYDHQGITEIFNYHEQSCISSAEGYVKASNFTEIGMACITAGPGVSNSITGLLSAFGDSVPMLVFAGQIKESDLNEYGLRTHGIQEINSERIVSPAVKKFIRINVTNFELQLTEIKHELLTGRPGPIFIEVPLNVQSQEVDESIVDQTLRSEIVYRAFQDLSENEDLVNVLLNSERLGLYIGNGFRISKCELKSLLELAKSKYIPRFYSWLSFDLENYNEPQNMGCPGGLASIHSNKILQTCDAVIFLGARLDLGTTAFQPNKFANNATRIIIDIDELELKKFNKPNDILIHADISDIYNSVLELLQKRSQDVTNRQKKWIEKSLTIKNESLKEEESKLISNTLNVRNIAIEVSKIAENPTIVAASSGLAEETFTRFLRPNGELRFFNGAALGSMGQGLAQGIGAAVYNKTRDIRTWVFEADGGLWMSIHEIATLSLMKNTKFTLCILNNGGYGSIDVSQIKHLKFNAGTNNQNGLNLPNWEKIAAIYSIPYFKIETQEDLKKYSTKMFNENETTFVDFRIPIEENRGPSLRTVLTKNGPTTSELESISW
jgi:acetolactate synthase-1/2/3 large subunit